MYYSELLNSSCEAKQDWTATMQKLSLTAIMHSFSPARTMQYCILESLGTLLHQ